MRRGAVRSVREDGRVRYHAAVTRDAYVEGEVQALADRLFAGDRQALAAFSSPADGGEGGPSG
jgi:BlaI family penicillinase repressor